jgi:hypothetical protein
MRTTAHALLAVSTLVLVTPSSGLAQSARPDAAPLAETPPPVAAPAPPQTPAPADKEKEVLWTLSVEARFRPEYRNELDLDSDADDDLRLGLMRLRLGAGVAWRDQMKVFAQIQDSRTAGEEISTASNDRNLDLHQGYADFAPPGGIDLTFRAGRQEWSYGEERMIGAFGWDNVGRSFDGLRLRWVRSRWTVDGLASRISSRSTPVLTPPISPPEAPSAATTGSDLFGVYAHWAPRNGDEVDLYWLEFADQASSAGEVIGTFGRTRIDAFGVRVKETAGRFDVVFEGVAESGEAGGDDLSAAAAGLQAGWTWGDQVKTRVFGGYDFGTGDEDPTDGERGEFFNFFPTNHPHYGYADFFGWRNVRSPLLGVSLKGGKHFGLIKGHRFELAEEAGPWKSAGGLVLGFDPTGSSGTRVGAEVDLLYRYAWTEKAAVEAGYARFDPDEFAEATRGDEASDWAYVMLTFRL